MTQIQQAQRIGKLMFRHIRNELTKKERAELNAWRNLSPENEQTFQDVIDPDKTWADLKALEESKAMYTDKTWPKKQEAARPPRSKLRRIGWVVLKVAGILLILLVVGIGYIFYRFATSESRSPKPDAADHLAAVIQFPDLEKNSDFNFGILAGFAKLNLKEGKNGWFIGGVPDDNGRRKHIYYRLFTSAGNHLQLNFSDSTRIWLNSNATIKYPSFQLTDSLHLFLNGEAYIHIPQGTKHVYLVKISPPVDSTQPSAFRKAVADKISRSIWLLTRGGDFYLNAYAGGAATRATLISGSLRIDSVGGRAVSPIILEPGQQAKLDSGSLKILRPDHIGDLFLWKNQ